MQNRPTIPWVTRSDLTSVDLGGAHGTTFAVKDGIKNEFFNFGELEFFILQKLRNVMTLENLRLAINQRFGLRLDPQEIVGYINRLAQDNLLVARKLGDGERLFRQSIAERNGLKTQKLMGLLSIKLPGFYPGPLLHALQPIGWLFFNAVSITLITLAAVATAIYALLGFETVVAKAPTFAELMTPNHLILMLIGFMVAKILHEIGHGLACQTVGRECSEMGVMLLVFMPVLYCDVSDLWTEKSRWKRIFVSMAGIFVELAIATICFWGWYFSLDGQLGRFLFGMMLVTSVNTLFINGNPLMRYDGYYALSDLVGIPNLGTVSRNHVARRLQEFFVRHTPEASLDRRGWFLSCYAIASFVYRWMILVAIGWAVWAFLDSQQLGTIGWGVVLLLMAIAVIPLLLGLKRFTGMAASRGLRFLNTGLIAGIAAVIGFAMFYVEFSHHVRGVADIELAEANQLFAPGSGQFIPVLRDGDWAEQGDVIAKIIDDELRLEELSQSGQLEDITLRLDALGLENESSLVAGEIEFWKKRKSSVERKLNEIHRRQKALEICSPINGQVVVNRLAKVEPGQDVQDLSIISHSPFAKFNQGCHVNRGDNLCYVADSSKCRGYLKVDEKEIELVRVGQTVRIPVSYTSRVVSAEVVKVSLESQPQLPNDGGDDPIQDLPTRTYLIEFELESDTVIRVGSTHLAVIECDKTTPAEWLKRWWHNSIWF